MVTAFNIVRGEFYYVLFFFDWVKLTEVVVDSLVSTKYFGNTKVSISWNLYKTLIIIIVRRAKKATGYESEDDINCS